MLLLPVLILSCSDEPTTSSGQTRFAVTIQINRYECEGPAWWTYAQQTGRSATVSVPDGGIRTQALKTDEYSRVELNLAGGYYDVLVETELGYPTWFDSVHIASDTLLKLAVSTRFRDPDTAEFVFVGGGGIRKLPADAYRKWAAIVANREEVFINAAENTSWPLAIVKVGERTYYQFKVVRSPDLAMWEVHDRLLGMASEFGETLFYAGAIGFHPCPEDSIQYSDGPWFQ
jgi:hypothetical protein